ncbi:MAG: response regulator [bacterium]
MSKTQIEIMVLDDEPIVGERLKDFLEGKGLTVETFTDSSKAIERIKEKQFDVVVTDYKMDGPTGLDVLRAINELSPSTQVIVITAYATIERIRESEALRAFEFVNKPFQLTDIHKKVLKAAKRKRK